MKEAAGRGERSVVYTFEEVQETLLRRCESLNIPVRAMIERGTLSVVQIEPLHLTPDEFAHIVRYEVEQQHAGIVMIDSIAGYSLSLRGDNVVRSLHTLCKYLQNMGVTVLLINEVVGVLKKRLSSFERTLREIEMSRYGIKVGRPLTNLQGILTGRISYIDAASKED